MSHTSNRRALLGLKQQRGLARNPFIEAVYAVDREWRRKRQAAMTMADFAQALAGTEEMRAAARLMSSTNDTTESAPRVAPAAPRSPQRAWSKTVRPGPHDVLSWDEVRRVPWIGWNEHECP